MKWILGLDLKPDSAGAVRTAAWMSAVTQPPARQRFFGVHVVPFAPRVDVRDDVVDDLVARAQRAAQDSVEAGGAREAMTKVEAVLGDEPNAHLAAACRYHGADGILIGRHAASDEEAFVRLGRVARRLIRELPAAVMVVPPNYRPETEQAGPVVAATDLSKDSIAAARFGLQIARELGAELLLAHIRRGSEYALTPEPRREDASEDGFDRWIAAYGLGGARTVTQTGDVVNRMLSIAHQENASMIVCGSRHLSTIQRVLQASTGTDLARFASRPVLVVPPEAIERVPG